MEAWAGRASSTRFLEVAELGLRSPDYSDPSARAVAHRLPGPLCLSPLTIFPLGPCVLKDKLHH